MCSAAVLKAGCTTDYDSKELRMLSSVTLNCQVFVSAEKYKNIFVLVIVLVYPSGRRIDKNLLRHRSVS